MKEITIRARITFLQESEKWFNFPVDKPIRTSFWLEHEVSSTFSQISFDQKEVHMNEIVEVNITLPYTEVFKDRLLTKTTFNLGVFPSIIAKGEIL